MEKEGDFRRERLVESLLERLGGAFGKEFQTSTPNDYTHMPPTQ
jgi:hypothetical protein